MSRSSRKCLSANSFSYKSNLWSMFGPCLCLRFANTLFTRIYQEFENWRDLSILSGKFLQQKPCYQESFHFFWFWMLCPTREISKSLIFAVGAILCGQNVYGNHFHNFIMSGIFPPLFKQVLGIFIPGCIQLWTWNRLKVCIELNQ